MKKHLFLLALALIAVTAFGQNPIPNGNFEQWNTDTISTPLNYNYSSNSDAFFTYNLPANVTMTTDAYHGNYAVKLVTEADATDTTFGYFLNTNPNNGNPATWVGGMPYNQSPTGIRGYYKYNVASLDSATIIIDFSSAGANIATYVYKIGGVQNSYTPFNFTFNPPLPSTPDSVIFAAASSNVMLNNGIAGSTLYIDSVSFTGVTSQPAMFNGDFESWQSQTYYVPFKWHLMDSRNGQGFNRTTDAALGTYAMELTTVPGSQNNHPAAQPGWISTGFYPRNCNNCTEQGGLPYTNQIDTLAFYYKYAPVANDTAMISVNFKKNGTSFQYAGMPLLAAATYQYIEIPFNVGQAPDTVIVDIMSSLWSDSLLSFVGSVLKIDEVHFKSHPLGTGISKYDYDNTINVYPNPTNGKLYIRGLKSNIQTLDIYNLLGVKVYSIANLQHQLLNEIDLSGLQKGIYFMNIYDGDKIHTQKIVLQ